MATDSPNEVLRSIVLMFQDFLDDFVNHKHLNAINLVGKSAFVTTRLIDNIGTYKDYTTNPEFDKYDNGKVPINTIADIFANSTLLFANITQFSKFSPIGAVVNILSIFATEVSNTLVSSMGTYQPKVYPHEIDDIAIEASKKVLLAWGDIMLDFATTLANELPRRPKTLVKRNH